VHLHPFFTELLRADKALHKGVVREEIGLVEFLQGVVGLEVEENLLNFLGAELGLIFALQL
jgi:hypothetical protein